MAYVDHAFSITDEDMMMETSYTMNNRAPIKEIALAVSLLVFGTLGIIIGIFMAINHIGGDRAHGVFFAILGSILFIPGFTIRGLLTTLIRVTKASLSPTYLLCNPPLAFPNFHMFLYISSLSYTLFTF
ncbi:hypothetical protein CFP56_003770 [Quercus suber]|uniref:Transmembrane protein 230 n=1 Tax=Quercus suber TaxID=58331 RepID=A0AAW0LDT4_QUESU